jgi:hypothetical protein
MSQIRDWLDTKWRRYDYLASSVDAALSTAHHYASKFHTPAQTVVCRGGVAPVETTRTKPFGACAHIYIVSHVTLRSNVDRDHNEQGILNSSTIEILNQ